MLSQPSGRGLSPLRDKCVVYVRAYISVVKNPTVAQLKQAVEDAFSHLPKHGIGKISWSHVWAQFCLCYEGQKLLLDQDNVGLHGIKDGDQVSIHPYNNDIKSLFLSLAMSARIASLQQLFFAYAYAGLQFVRHTSTSYNFIKGNSETRNNDLEESKATPSKQEVHTHEQYKEERHHSSEVHNDSNHKNKDENEEDSSDEIAVDITCQCSWAHLFRRLFSYRRQKGCDTNYVELGSLHPDYQKLRSELELIDEQDKKDSFKRVLAESKHIYQIPMYTQDDAVPFEMVQNRTPLGGVG
ncbi:ubiquitin-related domain-containing protein [Tanacetum coccineum]